MREIGSRPPNDLAVSGEGPRARWLQVTTAAAMTAAGDIGAAGFCGLPTTPRVEPPRDLVRSSALLGSSNISTSEGGARTLGSAAVSVGAGNAALPAPGARCGSGTPWSPSKRLLPVAGAARDQNALNDMA